MPDPATTPPAAHCTDERAIFDKHELANAFIRGESETGEPLDGKIYRIKRCRSTDEEEKIGGPLVFYAKFPDGYRVCLNEDDVRECLCERGA